MNYKEWKAKYIIEENHVSKNEKDDIIKLIRESSIDLKNLELNKVEYREVKRLDKNLEEYEIIVRLSWGEKTRGYCSSIAFAYAGNKNGWSIKKEI